MTETEAQRAARLAAEFWQRVGPRVNAQQHRSRPSKEVDEGDVETAVLRCMRGDRVPAGLTRAEMRLVAGRLTRAGRTAAEIAALLEVKQSLIEAWRARGHCQLQPV